MISCSGGPLRSISLSRDLATTNSSNTVELATVAFLAAIRHKVNDIVPWAKPSEWANPDFTPECKQAIKATRHLRRVFSKTRLPRAWNAYCRARNLKKRLVSKALRLNHRRRVQKATEQGPRGMWQLAKWVRTRAGAYESGVTPTLRNPDGALAETVDEKATFFQYAFFPAAPAADLTDIDDARYPHQIEFPLIEKHEIERTVLQTPPDKAPGEDGIPNSFWHRVIQIPVVVDTLFEIFNACIRLGCNPNHFQHSITVVLRKGGEDRDYRTPKAYCPIALLNTLGKILESIIAKSLSYAIESYGLLPSTHLGGRRGVSTDHAIQIILDRIHRARGKGQDVVSMLLLDVVGAYDNAHHQRLLHNMRKRRLGHFAPWVQAFLTNRSTRIRMPEGTSTRISTPTGIPQGSPISPILYLIYNADLLEDTQEDGVVSSGWVDDVSLMAAGTTELEMTTKLEWASGIADDWAKRHASIFDTKKYKLIHFVNPRSTTKPAFRPIRLQDGTQIEATKHAERYLGIWLDPDLTFQIHREKAVAKAGTSLQALQGLAGSTWGIALSSMRHLYQAIIVPQILYGVASWFRPDTLTKKQINALIRDFTSIQKRAACLISGAFRTTTASALNVELYLLPIKHQMEQLSQETAIRIRTGPSHATPNGLLIKRSDHELKLGGHTPMEVHAWKKGGCLLAPPDTLPGRWESRRAYIWEPWRAETSRTFENALPG
jgi:Reverse transcriptase (RNA-dependent DNA polymerase)